jgi:hypothetical protein
MKVIELKNYIESLREQKGLSEEKADKWRVLAYECVTTQDKLHRWMPTSWSVTSGAKHVTEMTCSACLHQITMQDLKECRYRLEE